MKTLQECTWKEFHVEELFSVKRGNANSVSSRQYNIGSTPLITASESTNGVYGFTQPQPTETTFSPTISINNNGSVGCTFVHSYPFIATSDVSVLEAKSTVSLYALKFVSPILQQNCAKYSYGYKISNQRLKRQTILLPVTPDGTPDWQYMEDYMRAVEHKLLTQALPILQERVNKQSNIQLPTLDKQNWKEFAIKEIFDTIQRGKRLKTDDHIVGNVPYVSSTAMNNGVDNFIGNMNGVRRFANCLTLANSGSVGATFYHPYTFVASDHVTKLQSTTMNGYVYLFIATIVARLGEKYGFNREINDMRISRESLLLPVTPDGTPDYAYMENYMRSLEARQLRHYLTYKK